jgi:hypothetical protein
MRCANSPPELAQSWRKKSAPTTPDAYPKGIGARGAPTPLGSRRTVGANESSHPLRLAIKKWVWSAGRTRE